MYVMDIIEDEKELAREEGLAEGRATGLVEGSRQKALEIQLMYCYNIRSAVCKMNYYGIINLWFLYVFVTLFDEIEDLGHFFMIIVRSSAKITLPADRVKLCVTPRILSI